MLISLVFLICFNGIVCPLPVDQQPAAPARSSYNSSLTGVYRIDIPSSDKLYSVVAGASSNVPFGEQQRFFIDLAVRLTPPDLLAIEQHGKRISLGSSRAPRMTFMADGVAHNSRAADGHLVRVRFSMERGRLIFSSAGKTEDNFTVVFESIDDGRRLRVVRRITSDALDQPLVIQTIYNKVSDVANWELYADSHTAGTSPTPATPIAPNSDRPRSTSGPAATVDPNTADVLRNALNSWIDATNNRNIDKQMAFYVNRLNAYYLTRNTSQRFVREDKARVFGSARTIDIRAEEPEIIFQDNGRTAIMRYRKKYNIENGRLSRRGEVIQELRWRRVGNDWRIFSERDIRVIGKQ